MYAISRAAAVLVMAGLLLGCATAAQRQYQAIAVNNRAALQGYEGCVTAIYDQPELEPLRHDLPRNVQNASLAQLANSSFVSPEQTRLILANHPKYQACRQQFINQIAPAMPAVATVVLKGATDTDNRIVGLLQKKLRWGEFLQQWREANQGSQGELPRRGWQHCGKLAAIAFCNRVNAYVI